MRIGVDEMGFDVEAAPDPTDTPELRDYCVTATVQMVIPAESKVGARLSIAEAIRDLIERSPYNMDPMNGFVVDAIEDITGE